MNNYTKELLKEVEATDSDNYKTNYESKLMSKAILSLLPDEDYLIQYAIYEVYRLGKKPGTHHYRKLNKFRKSEMASTLYYLLRGKDYTPEVMIPPKRKAYRYNSPCITVVEGELEIVLSESFMVDNPNIESLVW